jgi:hypothetical protein
VPWLVVDAALVVVALAVLAVLALNVRRQARSLSRDVAHSGESLAPVAVQLQKALEPLQNRSQPAGAAYDADNWPSRGRGGR